jgi:hypothetical protein
MTSNLEAKDDYSQRWVGDLSHPLEHVFVDGQGKPHDLTGVNTAGMTFVLVNKKTNARKVGQGTWTLGPLDPSDPAPQGKAVYHWNANDVNEAGLFDIQAGVLFSDGMLHFKIKELLFKQPL